MILELKTKRPKNKDPRPKPKPKRSLDSGPLSRFAFSDGPAAPPLLFWVIVVSSSWSHLDLCLTRVQVRIGGCGSHFASVEILRVPIAIVGCGVFASGACRRVSDTRRPLGEGGTCMVSISEREWWHWRCHERTNGDALVRFKLE